MATEVLRPQDCLIDRMRTPSSSSSPSPSYDVVFYRRSPPGGRKFARPAPAQAPSPAARAEPRRRTRTRTPEPKKAEEGPVMGQVTILRRGESLPDKLGGDRKMAAPSPASRAGDLIVFGTGRIGPDPGVVPVYSGTAFCQSPDPSNLPLPSFPTKKPGLLRAVDDSATKDLRRLLRLD